MQWASIIVPSLVSILGFIISYISLNRNIKAEILNQKSKLQIEKMANIPYEVFDLMDYISGKQGTPDEKENLKRFSQIMNTTYGYGSAKAVLIIAELQSRNYKLAENDNSDNKYKLMSLYVLLATQIKFDLTGEIISPDHWFKMKITDYDKNKGIIIKNCNDMIKTLSLSEGFLIK